MENRKRDSRQGVMGISWSLCLGCLLIVGSTPSVAKFYKWVDESGQVHYTQQPPSDSERYNSELISVDTRLTGAVLPEATEAKGSCGTITLPQKLSDPIGNIARLRQAITVWQKYLDENLNNTDAASREGVADRRCAIAYANKELQSLSDVESRLINNYESVRDELADLEQQVAQCDLPAEGDDDLSVEECKSQHQLRLGQLKTMLRELEGRKKMLEPAE